MSSKMMKAIVSFLGIVLLFVGLPSVAVSGYATSVDKVSVQPTHNLIYSEDVDQGFALYLPLIASKFPLSPTPLGVQYYGSVGSTTGFDHYRGTHAGWVRVPVIWSQIEPVNTTPDNYNWSASLDATARNVSSVNKEIILTLAGQPSWAAEYPAGPPYNTADLLEFMSALVERYNGDGINDAPGSPVIKYFELYNEPDNTDPLRAAHGGWGYWGNNAAGYADLMKALYPVIKAANPEAKLVFGGIALDWFVDQGGIFNRMFLDEVLYSCRGAKCFDYANFHYYPLFQGGWASYGRGIVGKTAYVRQKLAENGFHNTPIMATELGWVSSEASWGKSDELQARYVVQGFVRGLSVDLRAMIWFKSDDRGMTEGPGLLDNDYQPKLSYYAFETTARMLADTTFGRALTSADTGECPIEGYVFWKGPRRVDVVWTVDDTPFNEFDDPACLYRVWASSVNVVDKIGRSQVYRDADDGQLDGRVSIPVGGSPLFIEF